MWPGHPEQRLGRGADSYSGSCVLLETLSTARTMGTETAATSDAQPHGPRRAPLLSPGAENSAWKACLAQREDSYPAF